MERVTGARVTNDGEMTKLMVTFENGHGRSREVTYYCEMNSYPRPAICNVDLDEIIGLDYDDLYIYMRLAVLHSLKGAE